MNRVEKILMYIDNYKKYKNREFINYYEIFCLSKDSDISELKNEVKKLKILFHPDWLASLPDEMKEDFDKMTEIVLEMENDFGNKSKKETYDSNLEKFIREEEFKDIMTKSVATFNLAVTENIVKYGFMVTFAAISQLVVENNYNGFTSDFNIRDKVKKLGREKIVEILNSFKLRDDAELEEVVITYFTSLIKQNDKLLEKLKTYVIGCEQTLRKYDKNYVYWAIKGLHDKESYMAFSNNLNARTKMEEHLNYRDYLIMILIYFEYFKEKDSSLGYREVINMKENQIIKKYILDLEKNMYKLSHNSHRR